jgi:2-oxo-4-hydroxy-4-carboxy-5-ureidoimidazoline decarboxylase
VNEIARKLDAMSASEARAALARCCGARRWVDGMVALRPFRSDAGLFATAEAVWSEMGRDDILDAFSHHPRIGADVEKLREKFASTASWSEGEQSGVSGASDETLLALRDANVRYEEKFGFLFIVCATGKSAEEMLAILRGRLANDDPERELRVAAAEQAKITRIRLEKL